MNDLDLGTVSVTLQAKVNDARKEVQGFKDDLNEIPEAAEGASSKMLLIRRAGLLVAGAAAGASVALAAMASKAMYFADEMDRGAKIAGVGAGNFSQLAYAASKVGVSTEGLSNIIRELTENVGKAADGSKKHALALAALGIEAEAFRKLKPEEQFETIAQRISELPDPADRARAAVDLMGQSAAKLLPAFAMGARGLREAREEAVKLGKAMTDEQIEKLKKAKDEVDKLKAAWDGFALTLGGKVAPPLADVLRTLQGDIKVGGLRGDMGREEIVQQLEWQIKIRQANPEMNSPEQQRIADQQVANIRARIERLNQVGDTTGGGRRGRPARVDGLAGPGFDKATDDAEAEEAAEKEAEKARKERERARVADAKKDAAELKRLGESVAEDAERMNRETSERIAEDLQERTDSEAAARAEAIALEAQGLANIEEAEAEAARARAERIEEFRQAIQSEGEAETERYTAQLDMLNTMNEAELEAVGGFHEARERIEQEHQDRLLGIREAGMLTAAQFADMHWTGQVRTVAGAMANMTAGVARGSKAMFAIHKAAALASAILDAKSSVLGAYKFGARLGGPVLGAAFAAVAGAATAAHIASIAGSSFGGGGGGGGVGGGATPAAPTEPPEPARMIHIQGIDEASLFSGKSVRELLGRIQEALDDGAKLVIN